MSKCMGCNSDKGKGTYCDDCRMAIANEKRLAALAELQAEGERMTKDREFDLEKTSWDEAKKLKNLVDYGLTCHGSDLYKAGFNKALDLVMEEVKKRYDFGCSEAPFQGTYEDLFIDLKEIISKLRGE